MPTAAARFASREEELVLPSASVAVAPPLAVASPSSPSSASSSDFPPPWPRLVPHEWLKLEAASSTRAACGVGSEAGAPAAPKAKKDPHPRLVAAVLIDEARMPTSEERGTCDLRAACRVRRMVVGGGCVVAEAVQREVCKSRACCLHYGDKWWGVHADEMYRGYAHHTTGYI